MHMQNSSRSRKKDDKSVFDASHFEESENSESSGTDRRHVRFKRSSTPPRSILPRSSRSRTSKPTGRCLPASWTVSFLAILLVTFSIVHFNPPISPYLRVAINLARPFVNSTWASLSCGPCDSCDCGPHDQIPPHIADYVQQAISAALGTTLQRPNYALRSQGAIIVPFLTMPMEDSTCEPDDLLEDDDSSHPCCFFPGDRGKFAIRLSQLIYPTHITIDYTLPTSTMPHHAPRHLILWGLVDGSANKALFNSLIQFRDHHRSLGDGPSELGPLAFLPFANFTFNGHGVFPVQMFPIHPELVYVGMSSGVYILEVRSNWGGNSTGIRRVRLHGEEVH